MVVGFTPTYAISAYHHWCCEFESTSGRGVQHYVITFVSDLRHVGGLLRFPPPMKLTPRYNWNIVESGVKYHKSNNKHYSVDVTSLCWGFNFHHLVQFFLLNIKYGIYLCFKNKKYTNRFHHEIREVTLKTFFQRKI